MLFIRGIQKSSQVEKTSQECKYPSMTAFSRKQTFPWVSSKALNRQFIMKNMYLRKVYYLKAINQVRLKKQVKHSPHYTSKKARSTKQVKCSLHYILKQKAFSRNRAIKSKDLGKHTLFIHHLTSLQRKVSKSWCVTAGKFKPILTNPGMLNQKWA